MAHTLPAIANTKEPDSDFALIARLVRDYVWKYRRLVIIAALCMIVGAAATGITAWLLDPAVKLIFIDRREDMLLVIPAAVLAVMLIKAGAAYADALLLATVGQRTIADLQKRMFDVLVHSDLQRLNDVHSGRTISSFLNDALLVRATITRGATGAVRDFLSLIFLAGVMFWQDWFLAIIACVVLPIVSGGLRKLGKGVKKSTKASMAETGELSTIISETLDGRRIVKAYRLEDAARERAGASIERRVKMLIKAARGQAATVPMSEALTGVAIALIILYAGWRGLSGGMELNEFLSFMGAAMLAFQPVRALSSFYAALSEGTAALARIFAAIDVKRTINDSADAADLGAAIRDHGASIRFEDAGFSYHEDAPALSRVTFDVKPGETIALVGPSGAGKSTIFSLLLRFYDVEAGRIDIAGHDIRNVTLSSLRDAMALVTQEPFLFDDTVRANIAAGKPGADDAAIERAARAAAAHDFITALPQGYDTRLGEAGLRLSGGQRQRIAIARAMLRDAPILLLDEATSALDTQSERQVQDALNTLMKNRTTLVIAHRLSTVIDADRIIVLDKGAVAETGTHAQLLAKGGLYALLYRTNLLTDEAAAPAAQTAG